MTPGIPGLAARLALIRPFYAMDILAKARALEAQGRHIIHMEVGEPDFPTAGPILDAAKTALDSGHVHYTPALGLLELRQRIAAFYQDQYGVAVDYPHIAVTVGASGALLLALAALINPGDRVICPDPGYPCNRHFVHLLGGVPLALPLSETTAYQVTVADLKRCWQPGIKAVLLASPANPTGAVIPSAELKQIAAFVAANGAYLIVDEIYHGLVYDTELGSAAGLNEQTVVINSFSKYYGMTGWRLGWLLAAPWIVAAIDVLAQNLFLSPPTLAQQAALAAFSPAAREIHEQRRATFQQRREVLFQGLQGLGFSLPVRPAGAFYLYAGCERFTDDSKAFCEKLLAEQSVAVTPGLDFGDYLASRHIRFAYTSPIESLELGVLRISRFISDLR